MLKKLLIVLLSLLANLTLITAEVAVASSVKDVVIPQALLQLNVIEAKEAWLDNKQAISIVFSHGLSKDEDYTRFVTVTENGVSLKGQWVQAENKNCLYLKNISPENKYEIFIRPGIKSSNGLKLLAPEHFSLTTTHAIPNVDFVDEGKIFSAESFSSLQIDSTNIKQQKVAIYRLRDDKQAVLIQKLQSTPDISSWDSQYLIEFSELIREKTVESNQPEDQQVSNRIKLVEREVTPQAGLYFISIEAIKNTGEKISILSYFSLSDFTVHTNSLPSAVEVFVVSRETAKLIPKAKLKLIAKDTTIKTKTDKKGYARFPQDNPPYASWVFVEYNKQFALKKVPFSKRTYQNLTSTTAEIFLDKENYTAGDKLEFSLLLRDKENKAMMDKILRLVLLDSDKNVLSEQSMVTPELGNVSGFFQLPIDVKKLAAERWYLNVYLGGQDEEPISSASFSLFESNSENTKLDFLLESRVFSGKEKIKFDLKGVTNDGVVAELAPVVMKQQITWQRHPSRKYKDFSFGIQSDETLQSSHVIQTINLNAKGGFKFVLPKIKNQINSVLSLTIQGDMQQKGYPAVSQSETLAYWPAKNMIGVRSLNWGSEDVAFGVSIEIININAQDTLLAVKDLEIKVHQISGKTNWNYSQEFGWKKEDSSAPNLIEKRTLSIKNDEIKILDLALDAGNYLVEINNPETDLLTSYIFSVGKSMGDDIQPDQLRLSLNKNNYQAPDTAILSIESAFAGEAIIKLASDSMIHQLQKVNLSKGQTQIEIPLAKLWSKKQVAPAKVQVSVQAFHLDGQNYFVSSGEATLIISQEVTALSATLQTTPRIINIHSDDYKNTWAVLALSKVQQQDGSLSPLVQTLFFDKKGDAVMNNQAKKIRLDQQYTANLYFTDEVVKNLDVGFLKN